MIGDIKLHHAATQLLELVGLRAHDHAGRHGRRAGRRRAGAPSISTRHRRHEPNASTMSVAQSLGICVPISIAARMIEVPSGTVTLCPSMDSVTVAFDFERGRAKVDFVNQRHPENLNRPFPALPL